MLKRVSDNINNIPIPDTLKHLNALSLLEDEEYTFDGQVKSCYFCDSDDLEYHLIKENELQNFLWKKSLGYNEARFLLNFISDELKKENEILELVKGSHIMIITCKKCGTILQIGRFIMFDGYPISEVAFEEWDLIHINGKPGTLQDGKNTFTWEICPHCGGVVYGVLGIDGKEERQCRECFKLFPYYSQKGELLNYL